MSDDDLIGTFDDAWEDVSRGRHMVFANTDCMSPRLRCFYRRMYRDMRIRIPATPDFYVSNPQARYEGYSFGMSREEAKGWLWNVIVTHDMHLYLGSK